MSINVASKFRVPGTTIIILGWCLLNSVDILKQFITGTIPPVSFVPQKEHIRFQSANASKLDQGFGSFLKVFIVNDVEEGTNLMTDEPSVGSSLVGVFHLHLNRPLSEGRKTNVS